MTRSRTIAGFAYSLLALLALAAAARADVFHLANGGAVEGTWLNREEQPRRTYLVETGDGARITLTADQVARVETLTPEEEEYRRIRPTYADTVDGQWQLAEWCREHKLFNERDTHLERILALDPDHAEARRLLGYIKSEGGWATQDEIMKQRGYIRYKGRWRTKQEIDLMEAKHAQELAEKEWFQKINRWVNAYVHDGDAQARQSLLTINDPTAVKALTAALKSDDADRLKAVYVEALSHFETPEAVKALAMTAVEDPSDEVRLSCLEALRKHPAPGAIGYFVGQLKSKDNRIVNRAGAALAEMKDATTVAPLIDALVTTHKFKVQSGGPNQISTSFSPTGGGGMAMGGGPKIFTRQLNNEGVLEALVAITGQNFNFDQQAWRSWLGSQKRREAIELRRK